MSPQVHTSAAARGHFLRGTWGRDFGGRCTKKLLQPRPEATWSKMKQDEARVASMWSLVVAALHRMNWVIRDDQSRDQWPTCSACWRLHFLRVVSGFWSSMLQSKVLHHRKTRPWSHFPRMGVNLKVIATFEPCSAPFCIECLLTCFIRKSQYFIQSNQSFV